MHNELNANILLNRVETIKTIKVYSTFYSVFVNRKIIKFVTEVYSGENDRQSTHNHGLGNSCIVITSLIPTSSKTLAKGEAFWLGGI